MTDLISRVPWWLLIVGSVTLGLAPFQPAPHLFEKLSMLAEGSLQRPIDIFDLIMHSTFPLLLIVKSIMAVVRGSR